MARTTWAPGASALASAARAVDAVLSQGVTAEVALSQSVAKDAPPGAVPASERAAVQAVALGTLRWYLRLVPAVDSLLPRPAGVPAGVRALLVTAAHQIEYSRHAPELSVHIAVDAVRLLGFPSAAGLTNAVLRRFVEGRSALLARIDARLPGRTAHPVWLVQRLSAAWPASAERILSANNAHPPMTLRVDLSRSSIQTSIEALSGAGIDSSAVQWIPSAIVLDRPMAIWAVPGFAEGTVSVQDAGAQLAAGLLDARPGMRVLDACAAPGGKTCHLLERHSGIDLVAVDVDAARLELLRENLARLHRSAQVREGDARDPGTFWDGRPFERILVDAPCSSTGVIRRHPDIKLLRRATDIRAFAATQLQILRAAVPMLAPGGRLLYSTCSVLPEENEEVVRALLAAEAGLSTLGCAAALACAATGTLPPGAHACTVGLQLLPGAEAGTDGFYYACLEKTTAGA